MSERMAILKIGFSKSLMMNFGSFGAAKPP
jgi:hypothetical protein